MAGEELAARRRRAAYRATHRGTKEMDWMLGRFAVAVLPGLSGDTLDRFERLLGVPDPELQEWVLSPARDAGGEFAELVAAMRRFHGLDT